MSAYLVDPDKWGDGKQLPGGDWKALVQRLPALREIPADALEQLRRELKVRSVPAREVLFYERDVSEHAYILLRGIATLTYLNSRQRRVLLSILGPGEVFGAFPFLPEAWRGRLRCDVFRDALIGVIDWRRLAEILFGVPFSRFAAGASFLLGARSERFAQLMIVRNRPLRERLIDMVRYLAVQFGVRNSLGTIVDLPLTHADLADLIGASRPKVSHHMHLLEKEGVIIHERHRIVLNEANL